MVVSCAQMKAAEDALFATGVEAEPLMEKAGLGCAQAILQRFPQPGSAILFPGKGHNAGDAYVIGRHLLRHGWTVTERLIQEPGDLADLTAKKRSEFLAVRSAGERDESLSPGMGPTLAIDGLLGIGAKGPLREDFAALAREMEQMRLEQGVQVIAVDIPSGLDGDTGVPYPGAVVADLTLTIACVKSGLLADEALHHVGRLALIPLPEIVIQEGNEQLVTLHAPSLAPLIPPPPYSRHKAGAGRVGLVAGSLSYSGAPILAALGALRSGSGLLHLYCPADAHQLIVSRCPPEVMVHPFRSLEELHEESLDAIGIGPGLAGLPPEEVIRFLEVETRPLVVDAEALNDLSREEGLTRLANAPAPRLLTPHPGEMRRLAPQLSTALSRQEIASRFVREHPVTLLLKGSRTLIAEEGAPLSYNTTGHPGMATGGMGDVLTGVLTTLLARGISPYQSACLGSWLIGYSAELYLRGGNRAPEGIRASEVAQELPRALADLRRGAF